MNPQQLLFDFTAEERTPPEPIKRPHAHARCKNCEDVISDDNQASTGGGFCRQCIHELSHSDAALTRYAENHWRVGLEFPASAFPGKHREESAREYLERDAERFCDELYDYVKANCWDEYLDWLFRTY